MTSRATQRYACVVDSPRAARRFCARSLIRTLGDGAQTREVIDDAQMIVSELLTNAINARCAGAEVTVSVHEGVVRIEVVDDADGVPQPNRPSAADERGRGLMIVAALSSDWGYDVWARGKRVWAELRVA